MVDGWINDWLLLYPPQVKHLWFQQEQTREAAVVTTEALSKGELLLQLATARQWIERVITGLYIGGDDQWLPTTRASCPPFQLRHQYWCSW